MPIEEAVAVAERAATGPSGVVLGADMARQCLEAGLLTEVPVHLVPVLLGGGTRLFDRPDGGPVDLGRTSVHEDGQLTALRVTVA